MTTKRVFCARAHATTADAVLKLSQDATPWLHCGVTHRTPRGSFSPSPKGSINMSDDGGTEGGGVDSILLPALDAGEDFFLDAVSQEAIKTPNDEAPLPALINIWQCPMLNKFISVNEKGMSYAGWTCGWCLTESDGSKAPPFWGLNASKALWHVTKTSGYDIWPCGGYIPPNKMRQYQAFLQLKSEIRDLRIKKRDSLTLNIEDMQDRAVLLLANASTSSVQESLLVCLCAVTYYDCLFDFLCHQIADLCFPQPELIYTQVQPRQRSLLLSNILGCQ